MIVGHVYTVSLYSTWSMKINSLSYWDLKYYFLRSPKSEAYVIFAISFMGTLILVSVRIILIVALPCLFGEAKPCQAGLVLGQGTPFGILLYFDFKFIFQKRVSLFKHAYRGYIYAIQSQKKLQRTFSDHIRVFIASSQGQW